MFKSDVYFNLDTIEETATEARDKNSRIHDELIKNLKEFDYYEDLKIFTEQYSVNPEHTWNKEGRKLIGYRASHRIKIELNENLIDFIGNVVDAGIDSGSHLSYINFELSNEKQNEYRARALEKATNDARMKAEGISKGLEKKLGRIVSVSSSDFHYVPWRAVHESQIDFDQSEMLKDTITNIQPGEREVRGHVNIVYALN